MDDRQFDAFARSLIAATSRRGAIGALLGGLLGWPAFAARVAPTAAGGCRKRGQRCDRSKQCCGEARCSGGRKGRCVCRAGTTECGGDCVYLSDDAAHCGACGNSCPKDTDCCNGSCCPPGQRCCRGVCTDLTTDEQHCGGCTQACPAGMDCCGSRCRILSIDTRHCGACGNACPQGQECVDGQCACREPRRICQDGVCHDLQGDPRNCGECGRACQTNEVCRQGQCVCRTGFRQCLNTDSPVACGRPDDAVCNDGSECCGSSFGRFGDRCGSGRCEPCRGQQCQQDSDCCGGLPCRPIASGGDLYCGGCSGRSLDFCRNDADCCFAACTADESGRRICASLRGGRCQTSRDCRACRRGGNCFNACIDGRCRV